MEWRKLLVQIEQATRLRLVVGKTYPGQTSLDQPGA
jgi:hypothetical protein